MPNAMATLPATPPTVGMRPGLDWHELQCACAYGRQLQAQAMHDFLAGIARAVGSAVRGLMRRRADRFALLHMNDRMLADLGLRRMDVQGIAYGVIPVEQVTLLPEPASWSAEVAVLRPRRGAQRPHAGLDAAA